MLAHLLLVSLLGQEPAPLLRWYVAPDGNDAWDGLEPGRAGASGPFRTLRRAFDAARDSKRAGGRLSAPVLIELLPGVHRLDEPLVLTPEDSGSSHSLRVHVFPAAPANATGRDPADPAAGVVVSGGRPIGPFRRERIDGRELFVAEVPEARGGRWPFRELFVNGTRRPRARHPDRGFLAVAGIDDADARKPWNEGVKRLRFAPGDLDLLRASPVADAVVMCRWVESHVRVESVDFEQGVVAFREPTVFRVDSGDPWYLEGARAFLDAPGEWWLDEEEGRLFVVPRPDEELADPAADVVAPRLERLLVLAGEPDRPPTADGPSLDPDGVPGVIGRLRRVGRFVEHVTFERITFAHCAWRLPAGADPAAPRPSGFPQAAVGVPGAIAAVGARDCRFDGCAVKHVGGYAVELGRGCQDNLLLRCELSDLGAGGVKLGEAAIAASDSLRAERNSVVCCRIADGGRVFHSAVGIWVGQSPRNSIVDNEIRDFLYTGISLGWTWGYGPADAGGQRVWGNHVHHIGRRRDGEGPILSDLGGIYTLGAHGDTVISGNWFHDVAAFRYGGWGIYFDEGTARIEARDNLVARTTHGGFHQHYGRDNLVRRNVFAWGRDAQVQRSRCEPHTSFTFRENVVLFERGELFAGDLSDGRFAFEENLYWREDGGPLLFAGRTFDEWQLEGFDRGSRIADPRFAAAADDDWSLAEGSPARTILAEHVFVPPLRKVPWAHVADRPRNR